MADIFNLSDTWNDGGTVFNGIKLNVTDTASAAGSKLLDLQVGGTSKLSVDSSGDVVGISGYKIQLRGGGLSHLYKLNLVDRLGFSYSFGPYLQSDATNTLAQRNGVNAQTYNIYNSYTSATDFERAHLGWNDTADTFVVGTEAGSGGGTARGLSLDAASIGLYGVTPAAQAAHIADATDATDVITRVNAILVALENIGITAAA
jgi:hypothetical protein